MTHFTSKQRALLATVVTAALLSVGVWPASGEPAERVASACDRYVHLAWTNYTQAQSFRPSADQIVRAEIRIFFLEPYQGTVTGRLVLRPAFDANGYGVPGTTVAEMSTEVEGAAGTSQWVSLVPAQPVPVVTRMAGVEYGSAPTYSLEVDLPVDQFPGPARAPLAWMECGDIKEGRAYHVSGAQQVARFAADSEESYAAAAGVSGALPVAGPYQVHHQVGNFQYRIMGR